MLAVSRYSALSVMCPTCFASPGERCWSRDDDASAECVNVIWRHTNACHGARRRLAEQSKGKR